MILAPRLSQVWRRWAGLTHGASSPGAAPSPDPDLPRRRSLSTSLSWSVRPGSCGLPPRRRRGRRAPRGRLAPPRAQARSGQGQAVRPVPLAPPGQRVHSYRTAYRIATPGGSGGAPGAGRQRQGSAARPHETRCCRDVPRAVRMGGVARPLASDVSTRRRPCHSPNHWPREQGIDVVTIGQPCRLNVKHCAQF
jgi:hypothetical protein